MEETLEEARVTIRHLLAEESYNQQRIGELYNHVVANRLAEAAGYPSALEYFSQHVPELPLAQLSRYATVASTFSAETCARYGITCLSVLLASAQAAGLTREQLHEALRTQQDLPHSTALPGR